MIKDYSGNRKAYTAVLFSSQNREQVLRILEKLGESGLNFCLLDENEKSGSKLKRAGSVLAFLSAETAKDDGFQNRLSAANASGKPIIPVAFDESTQCDDVSRLLKARNIVFTDKYPDIDRLCERILSAEALKNPEISKEQKNAGKLRTAAALVGAVLILAALYFGTNKKEETESPSDLIGITDGISLEQLEKIKSLAIIGDKVISSEKSEDSGWISSLINDWQDEDGAFHVEWADSGEEVAKGRFNDYSALSQMPKLSRLIIVEQESCNLPNLASAEKLRSVYLENVEIESLEALSGTAVSNLELYNTRVADLSPLTSCEKLAKLVLSDANGCIESFEGFSPASLSELRLNCMPALSDASALSRCGIKNLDIFGLESLTDYGFLGGLSQLNNLSVSNCPGCTDLSAAENCSKLQNFSYYAAERVHALKSGFDFLAEKKSLKSVDIIIENLGGLAFLASVPSDGLSLHLSMYEGDLSGLQEADRFNFLSIDFWGGRDYSEIAPYLEKATVYNLSLHKFRNLDLSRLPAVTHDLQIYNSSGFSDFKNMQERFYALKVEGCQQLTSLSGIENCGINDIVIDNCPFLTDMEVLYEIPVRRIGFYHQMFLPDLSRIQFEKTPEIDLRDIPTLEDLSIFDAISDDTAKSIELRSLTLMNLGDADDMSPINRFHGLNITVSPEFAAQAEKLVETGNFEDFYVEYQQDDSDNGFEFSILSMEDLENYPASLLERATSFAICGDTVYDGMRYHVNIQDDGDVSKYFLVENDDENVVLCECGPGNLDNLRFLEKIPNLKELRLCNVPLENLEGLQVLNRLEFLHLFRCHELTDISAAFTLNSMNNLDICDCRSIETIQGIGNLNNLERFQLHWCPVRDASEINQLENLREVTISFDMPEAIASLGSDYTYNLTIEGGNNDENG